MFDKSTDIWAMGVTILEMYTHLGILIDRDLTDLLGKPTEELMGKHYASYLLNKLDDDNDNDSDSNASKDSNEKLYNLDTFISNNLTIPMDDNLLELLCNMIAYPGERISANQIINSKYYLSKQNLSRISHEDSLLELSKNCYELLKIREFTPYLSDIQIPKYKSKLIIVPSTQINYSMLQTLNSWICEVLNEYESPIYLYYLYILILLSYINYCNSTEFEHQEQINKGNLQKVGAACLYIAYEARMPSYMMVQIADLVYISDYIFTEEDLLIQIHQIQLALQFNFDLATTVDFLNHQLSINDTITDNQIVLIHDISLLLHVYSPIVLQYPPSILAELIIDFLNDLNDKTIDKTIRRKNDSNYAIIKDELLQTQNKIDPDETVLFERYQKIYKLLKR
jgi:hypothetical protein